MREELKFFYEILWIMCCTEDSLGQQFGLFVSELIPLSPDVPSYYWKQLQISVLQPHQINQVCETTEALIV